MGPPRWDCLTVFTPEARPGDKGSVDWGQHAGSARPKICQDQTVLRRMLLPLATPRYAGKRALPLPGLLPVGPFPGPLPTLPAIEAETDQADGPKEPPQSVRFASGKGHAGHHSEGPRGA